MSNTNSLQPKRQKRQLININTSNYVSGSGNKYSYKFPSPIKFSNCGVSLYQFNIYNSSYNISSALGNNTWSMNWLGTNYNFTIADGYYDISQLNSAFQFSMVENNLYLLNSSSSQYIYFFDIQVNSIQYKTQLDIYYIPTSTEASTLGYSLPSSASWTFPSIETYPQITLCSGLCSILGITNQTNNIFPSSTDASSKINLSFLSNTYPILSPVFAYTITCNLINSDFNVVPNILHQVPLNNSYGNLITLTNIPMADLTVRDSVYNSIEITLLDQNYLPLQYFDKEMVLSLLVTSEE